MIVVQRSKILLNENRYTFGIIKDTTDEFDLSLELNLLGSKVIKDTDDRPISNQGQDIR